MTNDPELHPRISLRFCAALWLGSIARHELIEKACRAFLSCFAEAWFGSRSYAIRACFLGFFCAGRDWDAASVARGHLKTDARIVPLWPTA
jgi:hypothetical protein